MKTKELLDNSFVWYVFRLLMDLFFGAYRKRKSLLREWGIMGGERSVLDVACGIGQFSDVTRGRYLGIDLNCSYIERAKQLRSTANVTFRCMNVKDLTDECSRFYTVLLIGILHHLDETTAKDLLVAVRRTTEQYIVVMEAIQEQTNFLGRWIKNNDRGEFMRSRMELNELVKSSGFTLKYERILYLGPTRTIATLWTPISADNV